MPKELEDRLKREAAAKGLTGERKNAYIFGTMRKTGWTPAREHPTGRGGLKPIAHDLKPLPIDETLWNQIRHVVPRTMPKKLPAFLGVIGDDVYVWMVDGAKIAREHDMDFISAGNSAEDPKMPNPGTHRPFIVLDSRMALSDLAFDCYHEEHERRDMMKGMSYDQAHVRANRAEHVLRMR